MFQAAVITASDKGAQGQREDISGQVIREILEANGYTPIAEKTSTLVVWQKVK